MILLLSTVVVTLWCGKLENPVLWLVSCWTRVLLHVTEQSGVWIPLHARNSLLTHSSLVFTRNIVPQLTPPAYSPLWCIIPHPYIRHFKRGVRIWSLGMPCAGCLPRSQCVRKVSAWCRGDKLSQCHLVRENWWDGAMASGACLYNPSLSLFLVVHCWSNNGTARFIAFYILLLYNSFRYFHYIYDAIYYTVVQQYSSTETTLLWVL